MTAPISTVDVPVDRAGTGDPATRTLFSANDLRRPGARFVYWGAVGLVTLLFALVFLGPLVWMVFSALKTPSELAQATQSLFPAHWQWGTFSEAWTRLDIGRFLLYTGYYAIGAWALQLAVAVTAAYALSMLRPMLGNVVLGLMLATLMVPAAAVLVPTYLTVVNLPLLHLNLLNTPWALWLPGAANAFNIYILKRFFDRLPVELLEAAAIDGAGSIRLLWSVVLPLARPVLAVVSIFIVVTSWKDFLWPLLVLQDPTVQTVNVAFSRLSFTTASGITEPLLLAGLTISCLPVIALFLLFQRNLLGGLSAGAVKG
ncbi:MAG TPA: carbohydrate ABC transporter permease [Mycobacteriales bacterium]|nr:carbohydrate ABC transporter permease [Mycobacteriales bacterium]